jgi:hypothetical protein
LWFCLSISDKNDIYSWGYNYLYTAGGVMDGQIGNGNNEDQLTPIKIYSFYKNNKFKK